MAPLSKYQERLFSLAIGFFFAFLTFYLMLGMIYLNQAEKIESVALTSTFALISSVFLALGLAKEG